MVPLLSTRPKMCIRDRHYLPILAQKGRAIRYARPVQNAVPAQFKMCIRDRWERKAKESRRPAEKERYAPPERESVRDQLRRLQAEGRQQKPKHRSRDRER